MFENFTYIIGFCLDLENNLLIITDNTVYRQEDENDKIRLVNKTKSVKIDSVDD